MNKGTKKGRESLHGDASPKKVSHSKILDEILKKVAPINFAKVLGLPPEANVTDKQIRILFIGEIIEIAKANKWDLCYKHGKVYGYNGQYWHPIEVDRLKHFLSNAAHKAKIKWDNAADFAFINQLVKQFEFFAVAPILESPDEATVLINLQNGTFQISGGKTSFRKFKSNDFLKYQLPFKYTPGANAPLFEKFLNRVLPDKSRQLVLAEFIASAFIPVNVCKFEKALVLYGTGANGKSVVFEVLKNLLGKENVTNYSLQSLCDSKGYHRAQIEDKLINYASEINGKMEGDIFKQLASGEPVEARLPHRDPYIISNYAKLIFNCNELPSDVEHTHAYFRRFIIIPFDETIPDVEQDKKLAQKIIASELSGIFNWVLEGLKRLLLQMEFSRCDAIEEKLHQYKKESDSTQMFTDDQEYVISIDNEIPLKALYTEYQDYCRSSGLRPVSLKVFSERIRMQGYEIKRLSSGRVVFIQKKSGHLLAVLNS